MNSKKPAFLPADSVPPAVETRSAEPAEAQARHCTRQSLALRRAPLGPLSAGPPVGGNTPLPTRGNPPRLDVIEALTYGGVEVGGSRFDCRPAGFLKGTLGNTLQERWEEWGGCRHRRESILDLGVKTGWGEALGFGKPS